jgi:hypothetical protein
MNTPVDFKHGFFQQCSFICSSSYITVLIVFKYHSTLCESWEPHFKLLSLFWNNNSLALVREITIPTERPSLVGEVSANEGVSRGQCGGSVRPYSRFYRPEPLLFLSSGSSIVLKRLSESRSRPSTSQKIWYCRE